MKPSPTIAERQNDEEAMTLIKASYHCLRNEQLLKYFMIVLSIGVCIAAIFNRYLDVLLMSVESLTPERITYIQEQISIYLNLASGVIIVVNLIFGFYASRMHTEGTVLRDRYDAYVFGNPPNLAILRPISATYVSVYAKKVHKKNENFKNYIYGDASVGNEAYAQFEYIKNEAHSDYKLYLSIQPFFMTLWIGFVVLIIIIAVSFNDMFVMTLINIMIPSLSAITMIGNSWYNCRLQMRELMVLINVIDQIEAMPTSRKLEYTKDPENIRLLADGLFKYRSSAFVIPNFLVKRHNKLMAKNKEALHGSETPRLVVAPHRSEAAVTTAKPQTVVVARPQTAVTAKPATMEKAAPSSQKTVIATSKPTASKTATSTAKTPQKATASAKTAAKPTKAVSPKTSTPTKTTAKAKTNTSTKSTKK